MSLGVILTTRMIVGEEAFAVWGWRIPFLVSIFLIAVSLYIRITLKESPLFAGLKKKGALSKNPIKESFGNPYNLKWVLLALFGATAGQGVVWYTGQFYALFYLQKVFAVPGVDANYIVGGALLLATPFFVVMGALSDRIGRKPIMMAGMALAVATYYPIYHAMARFAPTFPTDPAVLEKVKPIVTSQVEGWFGYAGYNPWMLGLFVFIQVMYVTMVYGPIAAFLVELFPTKIRYTSMSLPYHIGNGVFGGLVPIIGLSIIGATGNAFAGLWYPMAVAAATLVVGVLLVKETNHIDIHAGESIAQHAQHGIGGPAIQVQPDEV
jgi:MFS family permease